MGISRGQPLQLSLVVLATKCLRSSPTIMVITDDGDGSSGWQSYDSDEERGTRSGGDFFNPTATRATLTDTPNSEFLSARPFSVPDRRGLLSSGQFNPTGRVLSTSQLSTSDSRFSVASHFPGSAPSLLNHRLHLDNDPSVYLFAPPTVTTPPRAGHWTLTMDNMSVTELIDRLGSDEDAVRKMAVFKLQSNVGDPSFAEIFISDGGLSKLKYLIMKTSGNTLAYSLASFSRLLEVDKGWECVDQDMIQRVCWLLPSLRNDQC